MKKYIMNITSFLFIWAIFFSADIVFAAEIPVKLEEVKYFLQVVNTPFWIWLFRMIFCVSLLGILISFSYYQRKKD